MIIIPAKVQQPLLSANVVGNDKAYESYGLPLAGMRDEYKLPVPDCGRVLVPFVRCV